MNTSQPPIQSQINRNGFVITLILLIASIPSIILLIYFGYTSNLPQLYLPATILTASVGIDFYLFALIRRDKTNLAMLILMALFILNNIVLLFVLQGLGVIIAVVITTVLVAIIGLAMTSNFSAPGVLGAIAAVLFGGGAFYLDGLIGENRIQIQQLEFYAPYIALGIIVPIFIVFLHEFNRFSLQTKITVGILLTGSITVATITIFGLGRAGEIVTSISDKYESSVTSETENQILSTVQVEARTIDSIFAEIASDVVNLADYRADLDTQRNNFTNNSYWNSTERLIQLPSGQFGNSSADVASVFIPNTVLITEDLLTDLNTSMYLDFLAPNFLLTHPQIVAVYYISSSGYEIYYPNINLAKNVAADFDPTSQAFYKMATPERNPDRLPRWTDPHQGSAGTGAIITLSVPVYSETGEFKGAIGADIQLAKISESISGIQLGATDFAFLVDKNGFIISMPEQGYHLFGLVPEEVSGNPTLKQSIFDTKSQILQFAAQRIIINEANLINLTINGIPTYLAVAALPATEYKLVIFAPTHELNSQILASREEVQNEVDESLRSAGFILIALFIAALIISLFVGQVITRPIKRLTDAVQQIEGGNLSARADIAAQDESGLLARAFNSMAQTLTETLTGLEVRISERTSEIEKISQSNAYRATQFESIARISRVISSAQTLDRLMPQIVQTISEEFNYYHIGIFLLDIHKEFAVLAASNSEGGKRMLERNHRLRVGETGIVGFVTRSGHARVALDVGADAVFFNNPYLPETRSEIALPLRIGLDIFGALDVQSVETNAFTEEDVNILSVLADQVSIAIQNARSYQQSREALEQAELSAAQMIEQQWSQFLGKQQVTQYHFDGVEASQIVQNDKQSQNLAIPLILRGAKIGTLRLSTADPNRVWDEDEIAIAQATAERTALAIENARLLLEAQKRATKERTIGEISAKIGNSISLKSILETTIQELSNTLPGAEIAIQFTPDSPEQNNGSGAR